MISFPLLKYHIRSNAKFLLAFTAALCLFVTVMCNVFTPVTLGSLAGAAGGTMLGNLLGKANTLAGSLANTFFAIMAIIFPMLYSILVGNRLVAEQIDRGTLAGFLAAPVTKLKYVLTAAVYLIFSLALMWVVVGAVGCAAAHAFQPGELDVGVYLTMVAGCFLYHIAVSGFCFCASCVFNLSKTSLGIGGGVSLFFFFDALLVKLSDDLNFLKYFTLNTLFDTEKILEGSGYGTDFFLLAVTGIIMYAAGIIIFTKKNLPI